MFVAEHS